MESPDKEIISTIKELLGAGKAFAAVLLPGATRYRLFSKDGEGECRFVMREFNGGSSGQSVELRENSLSNAAINCKSGGKSVYERRFVSTEKQNYNKGARAIIEELKQSGGKTVYSRVVTVESENNPVEVMAAYHVQHPSTFRYISNSEEFGLWFGATPELVLDADATAGKIKTMALAGTRQNGEALVWDAKNSAEHGFVVKHIIDVFRGEGLEVSVSEGESLQFGNVEHLMHRIEAKGCFDAVKILDALTPTPAICGVGKEAALKHIAKYEEHERQCYGGEVGLTNNDRMLMYANLRCAHVRHIGNGTWQYALVVGGGLTADSDVEEEWQETELKAQSLRNVIELEKV